MRVDVVEAASSEHGREGPLAPADASGIASTPVTPADSTRALLRRGGLIEIILRGGVSVCVDAQVDEVALRRVLSSLEGR
jgi:hypothetical protein